MPDATGANGEAPVVTLLVAMRNEADNIVACLESIKAQDYPEALIEILVFDGNSTDSSTEIAERTLGHRPRASVRPNPRQTQAAAWNIGIEAAAGDVIGIVSGHSILAPDYVRAAIEVLRRTGAEMVGGPVRAIATGPVGEAIALAGSTSFGVGGASFHYLEEEQDVDTVYMGLSPRDVYRRFRFDEEMVRNQDDELSYRLLDSGLRIVCSPLIRSAYRSRGTLPGLWKQYFAYGSWKVRVMQKHPAQVRLRHIVPTTFVCSLIVGAAAALAWRPAALLPVGVLAAYGIAMARAIATIRPQPRSSVLPWLPPAYLTAHAAYGLGVLAGLIRHRHWEHGSLRLMLTQLVARARN